MVLKEILLENKKKIIRDLVDKITVYEGGDIELAGHLPQFDQKLGCFHGNRDIQDKTQHFVRFELKIKLPKLRKAREILQRDGFGRIIHSQPPVV